MTRRDGDLMLHRSMVRPSRGEVCGGGIAGILRGVRSFVSPISLQVPDGPSAPRLARRRVLGGLGDALPAAVAADVGLLVSELVTNSVRHAHVGTGMIDVEVSLLPSRLRLTVSDPGGESVPHVVGRDLDHGGGLGLFLVEALTSSWGVSREPGGVVRVWCEIPLEGGDHQAGLLDAERRARK
jgi:anti-sigma regulatory factor (Ser/Thr protein kinase)